MSERIRFMVRFASDNLEGYRAGDWLNLREDLQEFLHPSGAVDDYGFFAEPRPSSDLSENAIAKAQDGLVTLLQGFAASPPQALSDGRRVLRYTAHKTLRCEIKGDFTAWESPGK